MAKASRCTSIWRSFGKLMQEIDAIDVSGFDVKPEDLDEEDYGMVAGKPLFMSYMGYSIQDVGPTAPPT